jgi:hypothetical protein
LEGANLAKRPVTEAGKHERESLTDLGTRVLDTADHVS